MAFVFTVARYELAQVPKDVTGPRLSVHSL